MAEERHYPAVYRRLSDGLWEVLCSCGWHCGHVWNTEEEAEIAGDEHVVAIT